MWFEPFGGVVVVGSNVTITCWSNQLAILEMAYDRRTLLARSIGTSVRHHLVHVHEEDAGMIYCIGTKGIDQQIAVFNLTVWTVSKLFGCVMLTLLTWPDDCYNIYVVVIAQG